VNKLGNLNYSSRTLQKLQRYCLLFARKGKNFVMKIISF
jgi:hypothetical protein